MDKNAAAIRVTQLRNELERHNYSYYIEAKPTISDQDYDRLFSEPDPAAQEDFLKSLNPNSLEVVQAKCEPSLGEAGPEHRYQFERIGYFCMDPESATARSKVFNRTITLRDNWLKQLNKR